VGGRVRRGGAVAVVGRRVGTASLVVGRRECGISAGLRVVVGSQSQWARGTGVLVTGAFVVGRPVTDAAPTIGGCGLGRVVVCRPVHSVSASGRGGTLETGCVQAWCDGSVGTLETGCVGCSVDRVVCDCVTICSGSGGVVA
jgi:hypothetical protein